jgi:preprotein translocase subunit SecA
LLLNLLLLLPQGTKAIFDRKTHRKVWQRTTRLSYIYHAAHFLENRVPDEIAADVLDHLEQAQEAMIRAWGVAEWNRVSGLSLSAMNEATRQRFLDAFGEQRSSAIEDLPLNEMIGPEREMAIDLIGSQALTEIYRQLLLSIITELWVDYLTQMEGLRISIGLEAYAQRDPLVQYKNRAFGLFQDLLGNMRLAVISRMFTYRPRDLSAAQTSAVHADTDASTAGEVQIVAETEEQPVLEPEEGEEVLEAATASTQGSSVKQVNETAKPDAQSGGGKRKRRRHR